MARIEPRVGRRPRAAPRAVNSSFRRTKGSREIAITEEYLHDATNHLVIQLRTAAYPRNLSSLCQASASGSGLCSVFSGSRILLPLRA
jgi:hypothetical protein